MSLPLLNILIYLTSLASKALRGYAQGVSDFTDALNAAFVAGWSEASCPPVDPVSPTCDASDSHVALLWNLLEIELRPAWRQTIFAYEAGLITAAVLSKKTGVFELLRMLLCVTRYSDCYADPNDVSQLMQRLCFALETDLDTGLPKPSDEISEWSCEEYFRDPPAGLKRAIQKTAVGMDLPSWKRWLAGPQEDTWLGSSPGCGANLRRDNSALLWPSEGVFAHSVAHLGLVDTTWGEQSQLHKLQNLHFASIVGILHRAGVELSGRVVNLGAAAGKYEWDKRDSERYVWGDPATCLVKFGWSGVLFEADEERAAVTRLLIDGRRDVILHGAASPDSLLERSLEFFNRTTQTRGRNDEDADAGVLAIDLLKLDADNGDCDFLEAALRLPHGLDPLLLHVELGGFHAVSPPLIVRHRFSATAKYPHTDDIEADRQALIAHRGCSLSAAASVAVGYEMLQLEHSSAIFVRKDLASLFPVVAHLQPGQFLKERWKYYYWCQPWRPLDHPTFSFAGVKFDMRILSDERIEARHRVALLQRYLQNRDWQEDTYDFGVAF